jgi:hypothetical protein
METRASPLLYAGPRARLRLRLQRRRQPSRATDDGLPDRDDLE